MDKGKAKEEVEKIVIKFNSYPKKELDAMSEDQIKTWFIEPLFIALGWDTYDLFKEERVLKGRADYILKIGNQDKLVIEAKKTSVKLEEKEGRQAVSYAYHKNIKFSVLTNFKHIRVYHALSHIKNIDKNLLKDDKDYLRFDCENFIQDFDRLWLLSKPSIESGEINNLLKNVDKRVIKPIDETILTDLLQYREWLSKDLKSKRMHLEDSQIDEVVQVLIDRLIFMRSVEDRGLEAEDFLLKIIRDVEQGQTDMNLWAVLKSQFSRFDKTYNSKLFSEGILEKEGFFDNNILAKVIRGLYYGTQHHQERYRFDEIPVDILGRIYEQYLGVVLRGTEKRVKLELVSGKRKKMGIYYTPKYIVDYILDNTLVKYTKNKTLDEILEIKVVDPACGSGSFLLDAFEELKKIIEERLKRGEKSEKWDSFKEFKERLTLGQKATILTNCIYGVDLDEKAVELAQLNLLLKILDEETRETRKRILPNMKDNIKNGNSLISDSRFEKAFNWNAQFPDVFKNGGFDIVIGNPPYIKEYVNRKIFEKIKKSNSPVAKYYQGKMDFWYFFSCLALDIMKEHGLHSFIAQNNWITSAGASKLRSKILTDSRIIKFTDFNDFKVFQDAGIQTMVYVLEKENPADEYSLEYAKVEGTISEGELTQFLLQKTTSPNIINFEAQISPKELVGKTITFNNETFLDIISQIEKKANYHLQSKEVSTGIDVHQDFVNDKHLSVLKSSTINKGDGIFIISSEEKDKLNLTEREKEIVKAYYTTQELFQYYVNRKNSLWVIYSDKEVRKNINKYPSLKKHLDKYKKIITSDFAPYGLHRARDQRFFEGEKIISLRKTARPNFTYTDFPCYVSQTYFVIKSDKVDMKALSGILNSNLIYFWLDNKGKKQGKMLQVDKEPLLRVPIKLPDKKQEKRIKELVERIMLFHREKKSEQDIKNVEYEINEEVYKLYGITDKEKRIIEESLSR